MKKQPVEKKAAIEYLHWKRQGKIALSDFIGVRLAHPRYGVGKIVDYDSHNQMASIDLCSFGGDSVIHLTMYQLLGEDSKWTLNWKYMQRIAPETKKFWIGLAEHDAPSS